MENGNVSSFFGGVCENLALMGFGAKWGMVLLLLFWCWFEKVLVFSLFFFLFGFLFVVFYFLKGMVVMMLIKSVRFQHSKSMA